MDVDFFATHGYTLGEFTNKKYLFEIQGLVKSAFPFNPVEWHMLPGLTNEQHVEQVKKAVDLIVDSRLVIKLIEANKDLFFPFTGPDLDIQTAPHLRVSRPETESDMVDWHRDSFYGSTPWELNIWFPIFPLEPGAGLRVLPGSHAIPSEVRETVDPNEFRKTVEKGSTAHKIGFVYAPKTDDTIEAMKPGASVLNTPPYGSFVIFFGCAVHRAQNRSCKTRVSIDVRIKNSLAPTNTRPGYYQTLNNGTVTAVARRFLRQAS
jgi:hypothetical protein